MTLTSLAIAQIEFDKHQPNMVVDSSGGGALAMNLQAGETALVLPCPAWKKYGTAKTIKDNSTILHSHADDVIPYADSEELVRNSGLRFRERHSDAYAELTRCCIASGNHFAAARIAATQGDRSIVR